MSVKAVLFLDANQYLDLYRMPRGKQLLAALDEQKDYIFVTPQIVDEVNRNKVKVAASFLADVLKKMELSAMPVPDHMLGTADGRLQSLGKRMQEVRQEITKAREEFGELMQDLLDQVSQSKDEVSKALTVIFSKAVAPDENELKRANERKLRGNPPGKNTDPLGDQLSWEQILTKCKDEPKLWILTSDSDYATKHEERIFLNALLYQDLALMYQNEPEVFCFDTIAEGLKHFSATTEVKAKELLTPEETEQIKKEQESLPPLGWLVDSSGALSTAIRNADMSREFVRAALDSSQLANALASYKVAFDSSEMAKALASTKVAFDSSEVAKALASTKVAFDSSEIVKALASTKVAFDSSEIVKALASAKVAFDSSEIAKALAGYKVAFDSSQIAKALAGRPTSAKKRSAPKETKAKKGGS
jgi:hypothetical protein